MTSAAGPTTISPNLILFGAGIAAVVLVGGFIYMDIYKGHDYGGGSNILPDSYGRGVGSYPNWGWGSPAGDPSKHRCDGDMEYQAGLCYKRCKTYYKGVGPVCWEMKESEKRELDAYIKKQNDEIAAVTKEGKKKGYFFGSATKDPAAHPKITEQVYIADVKARQE